jgi:sugar lactone lactonase YvrE
MFIAGLLLGLSPAFSPLATPAGAAATDSAPKIYVLNQMQDKVLIFSGDSNGNVGPSGTIAGSETKLNDPHAMAFDAQGNLYVLNQGFMGSVTVYAPGASGNAQPIRTITGFSTKLKSGPEYLAVDGAGNVYVSESLDVSQVNGPGAKSIYADSLLVFPPGADGDVKPLRTIKGSATRMDGIRGLALDKAGNLYVANTGEPINGRDANMRVTVYAPGADGNAAPTRTIEGPNTGLHRPFFLSLDAAGNLYVANLAGSAGGVTTTVYARGASGDARPVRTLLRSPDA